MASAGRSVALALRVDIVSGDPAPTADLYLLCMSVCSSAPISGGGGVLRTRLASRSRMPELNSLTYCDNC